MKRGSRVVCFASLLTVAALAVPTLAWSEAFPARGPIPFEAFDSDGNGFISEQEFDAARGERIRERAQEGRPMRNLGNAPPFSSIDSDGDGRVSRQELSEHQARHRQRMQQR